MNINAARAAVALLLALAVNPTAYSATARPNCYAAEIEVLTVVDVQTDEGFDSQAIYEIAGTGNAYAMYCEDFLPGDHCLALICDNNTPDDVTDDWYVRVIRWLD